MSFSQKKASHVGLGQRRLRMAICMATTLAVGQGLARFSEWPWVYWGVTLPGTTLHELMHWISAWLLGGHPAGFSTFPTSTNGAMSSLGHVVFQPTWFNAATVALAPLFLGIFGLAIVIRSGHHTWRWILPFGYLAACCFASMWPSQADWSVASEQPSSFLLALPLAGITAWFTMRWKNKL